MLTLKTLTVAALLLVSAEAQALDRGRYGLTQIKRSSFNEYEARSGTSRLLIKTIYCAEFVFSGRGILVWQGSFGSKLVIVDDFDEDKRTVCDVSELWMRQD